VHRPKPTCLGNKITCYYDGDKKIETTDETFKDAGKIGLWTKADTVTYFDDLHVAAKLNEKIRHVIVTCERRANRHEVDYTRTGEGRPGRLSLADQEVC
jgi:hypothetical protein